MADDAAKSTTLNYPWLIALIILWHVVLAALPRYGGFNVSAAIGSLRAINSAQATYSSTCADGRYALDLADLAKPPVGGGQPFISPDLIPEPPATKVIKSGYEFTLTSGPARLTDSGLSRTTCNDSNNRPVSSYFASASPVGVGTWDTPLFLATDERGAIFVSRSGPIANPIPEGVPVEGEEGDVRGLVSSDWRYWAELLLMSVLLLGEGAIIWVIMWPISRSLGHPGRPLAALGLVLYALIRAFPGADAATIKYDDLHIEVLLAWTAVMLAATCVGVAAAGLRRIRPAAR